MAIKHGRKPEDVPKPDVDCEVKQTCYIQNLKKTIVGVIKNPMIFKLN